MTQSPEILPYPIVQPIKKVPAIKGQLCYFVKPYPMEGIAIVIFSTAGKFFVKAGTFSGKILDVAKLKKGSVESTIFATLVPKIIPVMRYVRIPQAEYYFSDGRLVDVRLSESKFVGPGMLKSIFDKVVPTQEILKIAQATDAEMTGASAILKPSLYKVMEVEDKVVPLYCKI